MQEKKHSYFEILVISAVVVLSIILGTGLYAGRAKVNKSRLLMQELSMFRSSISMFNIVNHRYPASLDELVASTYEIDSQSRPFVDRVHRSKSGELLDPFGKSYFYDAKSGWLRSSTEGYSQW